MSVTGGFLIEFKELGRGEKVAKFGGIIEHPVLHELQSGRGNTLSKWKNEKPTIEKSPYSKDICLF